MRDDWYGHRDLNFEPYGDKDEWLDWDYAIISALQTVEDFTDDRGLFVTDLDGEGVVISAVKKIDKLQASIDRKTSGDNYKPEPGERWIPDIEYRAEEPTFQAYLQKMREGGGQVEDTNWGAERYGMSWDELQAQENS